MIVGCEIVDMNNLVMERTKSIDFNEIFQGLDVENLRSIVKNKGIDIDGFNFVIYDEQRLIKYVLYLLFPEFEVLDTQHGYEVGHPDFILTKGDEKIYLELKINEDPLRFNQLKWFMENKEKINKILFIFYEKTVRETYFPGFL